MLLELPGLLPRAEALKLRDRLRAADWIDGNATSGHQSALAKRNRQLPEGSEVAQALGARVLDALAASPAFVAAALPLRVYPPLFNRYEAGAGDRFDAHVDSAVRIRAGSDFRIRADLSATMFLADPDEYDGGELVIEEGTAERRVKLGLGDMILYPATTLHRVTPVTRGARLASFFWIQSMVRDGAARAMLLDLDRAIQDLAARVGGDDPALVRLTGVYHNLLRRWAEMG